MNYNPPFQQSQYARYEPYPMNFVQAPSYYDQDLVMYRSNPYLQGLSIYYGPVMYPIRQPTICRGIYY